MAVIIPKRKLYMGKTKSKPLVSLCMATYSRPDLFPESLGGLLRQTYSPLEIVVLVDGSNAQVIEVLKALQDTRLRWITTPKPSGMVPAWNRVVREARGKYFLFCADDDVLQPNAVDYQVELLENNTTVGFCYADWRSINDEGEIIGHWFSHEGTFVKAGLKEWRHSIVRTTCCMQTAVVRMDKWCEVGGWDEGSGNPGDNSLYLKLLRISDVGHVAHIACHYRVRTRKPDSWEKRFRDAREFFCLSSRHLKNLPPNFPTSTNNLQARLCAHMSRATIGLVAEAPSHSDKDEFLQWATSSIWSRSLTGKLCKWVTWCKVEFLLQSWFYLINFVKAVVKRVVVKLR